MKINFPKFIKEIVKTQTLRQSAVTFSGTFINGALGAAFYILSARFLGPSAYGIMMLSISTLTLVGDIADLGTNTGLVRFVSAYIGKDKTKAYRFLKLGLEVKIVLTVASLLLGLWLSPYIADRIFLKPEIEEYLKIAFIGVGSALLFSFIISSLQSLQKFWIWSGIQVGTNAVRLILLLILFWLGMLDISSNLLVYVAMPLLGFFLGIGFIKTNFFKVKGELGVAREFFHYNKWVALFSLVAAFGARVDTFISGRLLSSSDLGIYAAANQIVQIIPQLVVAINTVVAPKMAATGSLKELLTYFKKVQVFVLSLAGLGILSMPIVVFIAPLLLGSEYVSVTPVFVILIFAMLIFLISVPLHMSIFYYFSRPSLFFWLSLVHLAVVSCSAWILIGSFGAAGAAVSVLLGQVLNFIIPLGWFLLKVKRYEPLAVKQ